MIDTYGKTPEQLCEIIENLTEERDHYKRELGLEAGRSELAKLQMRWRLTPREAQLLGAMHAIGGKVLSKQSALTALYSNQMDEPEIKIVDVFLCKVRKKMNNGEVRKGKFGSANQQYIETIWGTGYRLTPAGVAAVDAALMVGQC